MAGEHVPCDILKLAHQIAMHQFCWIADIVRKGMIAELNEAAARELRLKARAGAARRGMNKQREKKSR